MEKGKYVLVTDTHRGVYMGEFVEERNNGRTVKLEKMRHIFYRTEGPDEENNGVYSLATVGPQPGSRVGPPVTAIIHDVSKVVECSEAARKRAEKTSWNTK